MLVCLAWLWVAMVGPTAALSGAVHAGDGTPVSDARVVLHQGANQQIAITDASGAFSFATATLPATLDVAARGFSSRTLVVASSPIVVTLSPATVAESVVVSADRSGTWRDPVSGATVLDRRDLDVLPAETLDESLRAVSGFSLFRRSSAAFANPTTDGVTMRGLSASGASRGLVLLDGVPLNDGFGGWVTWTRVPDAAVGRVDIERGSEGDAYGSDALGGVIRIVTPEADRPSGAIGGEAGTMGEGSVELSGGERRGRIGLFGAASGFETDGSIPLAPVSRGAVDVPADASWVNGFGRLDVGGRERRLTIEDWGSRDDRGNGTVLQRNRMTGDTGAVTFDTAAGATTFAVRASVSPNSFYQTFTTVSASRATETLTSTQTTDTDTARAVVELGETLSRGQILVVGTATRDGATFTDLRPPTSSTPTSTTALQDDTEGVAAELNLGLIPTISLGAGVRQEWRAAPTSDAPHDDALVGHVATVWQPSATTSVRGSIATSHRWPTLNELVRNFQVGSVLTVANPNLLPEKSISGDGSVQFTRARWLVSLGGFHTIVDQAVANVTQPAGTVPGFSGIVRRRENAGDVNATGAELDGEVHPAAPVRLRASVTLIDATFQHSLEPALEGNQLPQVPRVSASLSGDVTFGRRLVTSAVWHAVSSQFDDDLNTFLLAPAYQLDLRLAGRAAGLDWHVVVENALNSQIDTGLTPLLSLAPGRALRVGATWRR